jgi:rSAM/selenodomain-associated transferase 2
MTFSHSLFKSRKASIASFLICVVAFVLTTLPLAFLGPIGKKLLIFGSLYFLSFLFLSGLILTFPKGWPLRKQRILIFLLVLIVHLSFLFFPASGDVNRYVWEGYVLNKGFNPYLYPPADPVLEPFRKEIPEIWAGINHKDKSACYAPIAMMLFRLSAFLSPTVLSFKILIFLFDLASIYVLYLLLRLHRLKSYYVLLFALNPLILVFLAGESHVDAIQIFFIVLCFYLFSKKREGLGFFTLGCAIMCKYIALIFLPLLIHSKNWKKLLFLIMPVIVFYLPFWNTGGRLFTSLIPFATVMHYNDSLTVFLRLFFESNTILFSAILFGICLVIIFLIVHEPLKSCYLASGCLLVLLTTLHPWYLSLITPFLAFFPSTAWLYLHLSVVFTFPVLSTEYYTGIFQEIGWLKLLEFLPFYVLLIWAVFRRSYLFPIRHFQPVSKLSIVIPTLNESENIGPCLQAIHNQESVHEVILVDGGSKDNTKQIAKSYEAQIIDSKRGRGHQIKAGVDHSQADVILILHADCVLREGITAKVINVLRKNPQYTGGAVGMSYFHSSLSNRFIAFLNNARCSLAGISFGDQAQFFRREALPLIGGFPDMMLMEDLELSMRLKEIGPLCFIPKGVISSGRRWKELGFWPNVKRVLSLSMSYLVRRRLRIGASGGIDWYESYYSRHN